MVSHQAANSNMVSHQAANSNMVSHQAANSNTVSHNRLTAHFAGKRVLVTGHTGFTGAWMTTLLHDMGADVVGFALEPETPSLFEQAGVQSMCHSVTGDIRDRSAVNHLIDQYRPSVVIHLAAQALVLDSFADPVTTFDTNVVGTAVLLDALRTGSGVESVVVVTSDKCYEPTTKACVENDRLGGHDPYSASKAAAELVVAAFRRTWFTASGPRVATARAGNIIGGGEWGENRLIPDCVRAAAVGCPVVLRHPHAIRPWQHVLDAIHGYLTIAAALLDDARGEQHVDRSRVSPARAWNVGPDPRALPTVAELVAVFMSHWPGTNSHVIIDSTAMPENPVLRLDAGAIGSVLGWKPFLDATQAAAWAARWYHQHHLGVDALSLMRHDIAQHGRRRGLTNSTIAGQDLAWSR
jgi:CDP-glucose 4,6-dehydratase